MKKIMKKTIQVICNKASAIVSVVCVGIMLASVSVAVVADNSTDMDLESYEIKALGRIDSDTDQSGVAGDHPSDVVYDADDFITMNSMVKSGKQSLSTALNSYPNTEVAAIDTFANLTTAVDNLTSIPDIYYYDKATEGPDCVRYMLIDGSYYPCDQYGNKISEIALSGTITVVTKDDTTEPAKGEIQLVKYEQIGAENLSAGFAGYADKSFILGNGSDNISYRNQGAANSKVGTATAAQVLNGKTFTNNSGIGLTGTMPNQGAWKNTPTGSGKVTIPAGYHNGSGYVDTATVYTNAYNAGVTAADARVNTSSASYAQGYNVGKSAGTTTILNSFSGQDLNHPCDRAEWKTTIGNMSGYTKIEGYKWVYNTMTVARITNPEFFSYLKCEYIYGNGYREGTTWVEGYSSASFELKGDSGTTYYTGDGLSINVSSITEPVTLYATWGVNHQNSSQMGVFYVTNVYCTIK